MTATDTARRAAKHRRDMAEYARAERAEVHPVSIVQVSGPPMLGTNPAHYPDPEVGCVNCGATLDRPEYREPTDDGRWQCIGGLPTCYGEGPYSLLDFDTAEAIGLDGTLRDGSEPYVWARLDDARLLYALAVLGRDVSYSEVNPLEAQERYDNAQAAATLRWTEAGMERLSTYITGCRATCDEFAQMALDETALLLGIVTGSDLPEWMTRD